jgi:hypothetical protein
MREAASGVSRMAANDELKSRDAEPWCGVQIVGVLFSRHRTRQTSAQSRSFQRSGFRFIRKTNELLSQHFWCLAVKEHAKPLFEANQLEVGCYEGCLARTVEKT